MEKNQFVHSGSAPTTTSSSSLEFPDVVSSGVVFVLSLLTATLIDFAMLRHHRGVNFMGVTVAIAFIWHVLVFRGRPGARLPWLPAVLFLAVGGAMSLQSEGAVDQVFHPLWAAALLYLGVASRNRLMGLESAAVSPLAPRLFRAPSIFSKNLGDRLSGGGGGGARLTARHVLIGLAVAIPIVALLLMLMGQADVAFENALGRFFETLKDVPSHIFWIIFFTVAFSYWISALVLARRVEKRTARPLEFPLISSVVVLASVAAVLSWFLFVHARSLLMSETEIMKATGMALRTYIRRGFAELLVAEALVGATTLVILHTGPWRSGARAAHKALAWLLIALTVCLSMSSAARLAYYIDEKGLSLVRSLNAAGIALSFACLIYLAVLTARPATLYRAIGMIARFSLIFYVAWAWTFPARTIAWYNAEKYIEGRPIELWYLGHLGPDAYPAFVWVLESGKLQPVDMDKTSVEWYENLITAECADLAERAWFERTPGTAAALEAFKKSQYGRRVCKF